MRASVRAKERKMKRVWEMASKRCHGREGAKSREKSDAFAQSIPLLHSISWLMIKPQIMVCFYHFPPRKEKKHRFYYVQFACSLRINCLLFVCFDYKWSRYINPLFRRMTRLLLLLLSSILCITFTLHFMNKSAMNGPTTASNWFKDIVALIWCYINIFQFMSQTNKSFNF